MAGVIGKEFSMRVLADVHPTSPAIAELRKDLQYLEESGFIVRNSTLDDNENRDVMFTFKV